MKDFFDTWKFKILVAVAVFLVGIMAYAGANGRLTAAPQELLGVILTPFQKAAAVVSGGVGTVWEKYTSIDDVMAENETLKAENAELRQQMVDYDRIKAENEAYKALARMIDYVIDGGVDYIVALGTTAETPTLYMPERAVIAMFITNQIAGRVPLVMGCGGNSTSELSLIHI